MFLFAFCLNKRRERDRESGKEIRTRQCRRRRRREIKRQTESFEMNQIEVTRFSLFLRFH